MKHKWYVIEAKTDTGWAQTQGAWEAYAEAMEELASRRKQDPIQGFRLVQVSQTRKVKGA